MISECFVHLQLPGSLEVVTAGRFRLEQVEGQPLGRFVYGRRYLADPRAVALDPVELVLAPGEHRTTGLGGLFGALRDAAPDAWGRLLIERRLARIDLSELDYLLASPDDRAGALSFSVSAQPPHSGQGRMENAHEIMDLADLQRADTLQVTVSSPSPASAELLDRLFPGTSLGGARPKCTVIHDGALWLAKFEAPRDRFNVPRAEHATLRLAAEVGIRAPESRLIRVGERDVLLVKRFDRIPTQTGFLRPRMISALTLLRGEESDRGRWSYLLLADELARTSEQPAADLEDLFLRMAFNALVHNDDDHPRNHALLAPGPHWRLAPAYDLLPRPSQARERFLALVCGPNGRQASRKNLCAAAPRFRLSTARAEALLDPLQMAITQRWEPLLIEAGASAADRALLSSAFIHPGFED